jgi:hypothetical protein
MAIGKNRPLYRFRGELFMRPGLSPHLSVSALHNMMLSSAIASALYGARC